MRHQSGNILFLILIAIALLGGLTVLLSRTGSQSDDTGDGEKASIIASEIIGYGANLGSAIQNLIAKGCSENTISFWNDSNGDGVESAADEYYNSASPTDRSCHVFHASGAGIKEETFRKKYSNIIKNIRTVSGNQIQDVGKTCAAASCAELILWIRTLGAQNLCNDVNRRNGIVTNTTGITGLQDSPMFVGTFTVPAQTLGSAANGPTFAGKKIGCYLDTENSGGVPYQDIYYTLLAR